jgi:hypothetical protein
MNDFSSIQKCPTAMRMLEYEAPTDAKYEYLCLSWTHACTYSAVWWWICLDQTI